MKIKCPSNLAGSAGYIGPIYFDETGVSEDVPAEKAKIFLACFGGEMLDLPEGANTIDEAIAMERTAAEEKAAEEYYARLKIQQEKEALLSAKSAPKNAQSSEPAYTRDALELLADKEGIKGIREIAAEFDLKGNSIHKLIDAILEAQKGNPQPVSEAGNQG